MIVKIDSSTVRLTGNPTLERNVKEELDTGTMTVVSTRSFRYEMYGKVDITTPYLDVEQYLVQADNPVRLNATEYEHNLTLIENIAFFNTLYTADRSFKIIGQTLEDILIAYKRELEAYHDTLITWTTIPQAVLDEVIPYKEFSGLNFSSILLSLFRKLWAIPKVTRDGNNWDIYPQYISAKNNLIEGTTISEMYQQNNVDYATRVKSQLKNAVNETTEATYFPSELGYVLPRSSSLEKVTSKLRYELDSNIVSILEAIAIDMTLTTININTTVTTTYSNIDIDLTSQIIQDEVWDLLPVTTSVSSEIIAFTDNVKNHIRYKVGQPYITNLYELGSDGIIFNFNTEYLIDAIWRGFYKENVIDPTIERAGTMSPNATDEIKMRFKYVKQRDMDIVHSRKTKGNMNETTTIHQQRDSSVELNEYKKNLKLYSNRMGNNTYSKTKIFNYPDEPYQPFDYLDEKIIVTRVQNTYHNTYVYCEYEESDNFSNIEAEYALMRRSDPYTINAKAVTTNLIIQESMEFSSQARALDTRLLSNARRLLLGLFEATTIGIDKVSFGVFTPDLASWNSNYAIQMPVESSGDGNLITMHVQFPHQTVAGKTYYDLDTDSYEIYLNPLPYTDVDGTLEDYSLYFTSDVLFEDAGQYPLILDQTAYEAVALTTVGAIEPIDLDSAASFAVTFEVNITSDENIYIGNALASANYFIKDQATTTAIAIYNSTKPYGQYDQVPRTTDTDITASVTYAYSFANRTISITPTLDIDYFSIVKDGDILLAINRPVVAGETYVININHIGSNVFSILSAISYVVTSSLETTSLYAPNYALAAEFIATATSEMLSEIGKYNFDAQIDLSAVATLDVLSQIGKYNQTVAIDLEATAVLSSITVQAINYPKSISLSASAVNEIVYGYYPNYSGVIEMTATATMNVITFTDLIGQDFNAIISLSATAASDITYGYYPNYSKAISLSSSAIINLQYNVLRPIEVSYTTTATLDVVTTYSPNPSPVEWVEIASGTPTGGNCIILTDEGNIKSQLEDRCNFINDGASYESATDLTTTPPTCGLNASYTVCLPFEGVYFCQDKIAEITEETILYECQLV